MAIMESIDSLESPRGCGGDGSEKVTKADVGKRLEIIGPSA